MIDPRKLEKQRRLLDATRVEVRLTIAQARLVKAQNVLRMAQLEAVKLGIRTECDKCGRELTKGTQGPTCRQCRNAEWMAKAREVGKVTIRPWPKAVPDQEAM